MFRVFFEGNYKLNKMVQKKVIALVGSSKNGKSTCHHWLVGKPLIGVEKDDSLIHY